MDFVLSRRTKAETRRVIRPGMTYATFAKHTKSESWVEREARSQFQFHPKDCLDRLGIEDAEISDLNAVAEATKKEAPISGRAWKRRMFHSDEGA